MSRVAIMPFASVKVRGRENIPRDGKATIIVANHQSNLDSNICSHLSDLNFKVTFKRELYLTPGVGTALYMAGHVAVTRGGDEASRKSVMDRCKEYLRKGVWVFFFAEGTRKIDEASGPLGPFKKGAFHLAIEEGVRILPITVSGARDLMPARGFPTLGYGEPLLTVHPVIDSQGKTADQLLEATRAAILSGLRPCDYNGGVVTPVADGEGAGAKASSRGDAAVASPPVSSNSSSRKAGKQS